MKRIYFIILLLLFIKFSYSQENLQFSKVVYIICPSSTSPINDTLITISTNKVWKINAIFTYSTSDVKLDSKFVYFGNQTKFDRFKPFWLPEGTYNFSSSNASRFSISAIEYNIIE